MQTHTILNYTAKLYIYVSTPIPANMQQTSLRKQALRYFFSRSAAVKLRNRYSGRYTEPIRFFVPVQYIYAYKTLGLCIIYILIHFQAAYVGGDEMLRQGLMGNTIFGYEPIQSRRAQYVQLNDNCYRFINISTNGTNERGYI